MTDVKGPSPQWVVPTLGRLSKPRGHMPVSSFPSWPLYQSVPALKSTVTLRGLLQREAREEDTMAVNTLPYRLTAGAN